MAQINNLPGKNTKKNNITDSQLLIDDVSLIAETLNEYFVTIGSKSASKNSGDLSDETNADHNTSYPSALFKVSEIREDKVIAELRNCKATKSTGNDSMPARVLKISADIIAPSYL